MLFQTKSREARASGIGSWDWNLNAENCTYHGLFPRAWTIYDGISLISQR